MGPRIGIPMRWKILVAVLFVVTTVVSLITFTMARMFHHDKKAYVSDMVSVMAIHAAQEAHVVLSSYRDRLVAFGEILDDQAIAPERKRQLMQDLFSSMRGFVALRIFENEVEVGSLFDESALAAAGWAPAAYAAKLRAQALPLSSIRSQGLLLTNSTVSERLPTLTIALPLPGSASSIVLAGVLDVQRVLALGRSSKAFEVFLVDAEGRLLVHGDPKLVAQGTRFEWVPKIPKGSLAVVREYSRDRVEMIGGFSSVGFGQLQVGAQIPRAAAYFASRQLLNQLVLVALALLLGATVVGLFWSSRITRSIARLAEATRAIGRGDFGVQVPVAGHDEMGQLADSFNRMAAELHDRDGALKQAQTQLIQSEKMAAFGQLGAGIAHEIKNPLAGIQGIAQLSARDLPPGHAMSEPLAIIEKETRRCRAIIDNLLRFARQERVALEPLTVGPVVEDAAAIMRHQMALHRVELRTTIAPDLPQVRGSANQLQQVLMNLMLNAEQAMEGVGGVVEVLAARVDSEAVEIRVRDNGPGIPEDIQRRIFEPFFTTKPAGKGTGLGLSVTFGIIREHQGTIAVDSQLGKGTSFVIRLPALQADPVGMVPPTRENRADPLDEARAA